MVRLGMVGGWLVDGWRAGFVDRKDKIRGVGCCDGFGGWGWGDWKGGR